MRIFCLLAATAVLLAPAVPAQEDAKPPPCSAPEFRQLDFWLGVWDVSWNRDGHSGRGKNVITRTLDDCAIEERFTIFGGKRPFAGMSISIWDAKAKSWRQTWVDNSGNYMPFTGGLSPEGFQFRLEKTDDDLVRRMIWKNVMEDSLDWHWQESKDGGKTWQDNWVIHYQRAS